ncbi:MAG: winged helix-turn-helix domain-containing protein [Methylobacterium sp.]|uniref:hypothetical protein n=1 Tax=Methylobacterium sp. TaxID=409 RepID=UPI0025E87999|nr:hypothetical protein [Methylobacterium sp.]MBX9934893.1 winged helix-turn-helix domain-containing protein [Methylobacterium sp.]
MAFLTQSQAEARLEILRRQREVIEREIADCLAFLELGRRLQTSQAVPSPEAPVRLFPETSGEADIPPAISDPGTRGRGRAIIAACLATLRDTGRPMHASELLDRLRAAGFDVAGLDPVAALNTRLWKRSGAGGPFRRLGDAVYDLAPEGDAPSADGASDT